VVCAGEKLLVDRITADLKLYFDENILYSKSYNKDDLTLDDINFLRLVKHREITSLGASISQLEIKITGNNLLQARFYSLIKKLLKIKVECEFKPKQPGFMSVFSEPKADLRLRHLQESEGCFIKVIPDGFLLVSDELLKIDNVKFCLEEIAASEIGTEELEHELMADMDKETKDRIEAECTKEDLVIKWSLNKISVSGKRANILRSLKRITKILIDLANARMRQASAQLAGQKVRWEFESETIDGWREYNLLASYQIEEAWSKK